jgi:hypothetical protein
MKTYRGSCHCGSVAYEADIDFAADGTSKCNCTICWKRRWWGVRIRPTQLRILRGAEHLVSYPETGPSVSGGPGGFCRTCGVLPFQQAEAAEWNGGVTVSINVSTLDDLDPAELLAARVQYFNGRDDAWERPPNESRHL